MRQIEEPKTCRNCRRAYKPLRRGRCKACDQYLRRTSGERPRVLENRLQYSPPDQRRRGEGSRAHEFAQPSMN